MSNEYLKQDITSINASRKVLKLYRASPFYGKYILEWKKYLQSKITLEQIERGWEEEGRVFRKHVGTPIESKKAINGKCYTIIPPLLYKEMRKKFAEEAVLTISKKNWKDAIKIKVFVHKLYPSVYIIGNEAIECTGRYIDSIALPVVNIDSGKKRCPIVQCTKKYEQKEHECFIDSKEIPIEYHILLTSRNNKSSLYILDAKKCSTTEEPYLIETLHRVLIMPKENFNSQMPNLICPYCACDKKNKFIQSFSQFIFITPYIDTEAFGEKLFCQAEYLCMQCSKTFFLYLATEKSYERLKTGNQLSDRSEFRKHDGLVLYHYKKRSIDKILKGLDRVREE